jgi:hypothetical protein
MFQAIQPTDVFKNYHQNLMVGPPHPMQNPNVNHSPPAVMQFPQENQRDQSENGEKPVEKDQKSLNQKRKTPSSKTSFKKSAQPSQQTQMLRRPQRKTQIRIGKIENKPFKCITCKEGFKMKEERDAHELNDHKTWLNICSECNFRSNEKSKLNDHQRMHQMVKCKTCNKFYSKNYISRHIKIHQNTPKTHKCLDCGQMFSAARNLRLHRINKICLGGTEFPCPRCKKIYKCLQSLHRHQYSHFWSFG